MARANLLIAKIATRRPPVSDSTELQRFFKSHGIDSEKVRKRAEAKRARNAAKKAAGNTG